MTISAFNRPVPEKKIDATLKGMRTRNGHIKLNLEQDVNFSTAALESYSFSKWEPVIYDAMVLAAVVEFGDRIVKRSSLAWGRKIHIRVPVHEPKRWKSPDVSHALHDALNFLTGDLWTIDFIQRPYDAESPTQPHLNLPVPTQAILAYSDGMDSRAVAGIAGTSLSNGNLVRVRVGAKGGDIPKSKTGRTPFTKVPYDVSFKGHNNLESSARSRGFKFALITSIAAYLTDADEIIIPESGQGIFGPEMVVSGHAYPDYRNHPLFTVRMRRFIRTLFGKAPPFVFPRMWYTKGETLKEYVSLPEEHDWNKTHSCWRENRWSSVGGTRRQCGTCAACMLRRLAVHAAGLTEEPDAYICRDMMAETLERAIDPDFKKLGKAYREYAIAGTLHMKHLAEMSQPRFDADVKRCATLLAPCIETSYEETHKNLKTLLTKHSMEWNDYLKSLGSKSFVAKWV